MVSKRVLKLRKEFQERLRERVRLVNAVKEGKLRPSPSEHAKDHKWKELRGNDGNGYISRPDKNGVYRWRDGPDDVPIATSCSPITREARAIRSDQRKIFARLREHSYAVHALPTDAYSESLYGGLKEDLATNGWTIMRESPYGHDLFIAYHPSLSLDDEDLREAIKDTLCMLASRRRH